MDASRPDRTSPSEAKKLQSGSQPLFREDPHKGGLYPSSITHETSADSFFLKRWLSRRSFVAGMTGSIATLLLAPWQRLFRIPSSTPVVRTAASQLDLSAGNLSSWIAEGEAFLTQPIRGDRFKVSQVKPNLVPLGGDYWDGPYPVGNLGEFWISTEDHLTGTLTSGEFMIERDLPWFNFLISGNNDITTHSVSLLIKATRANAATLMGKYPLVQIANVGSFYEVFAATGHGNEIMRRVSFDASQLVGELARVRVVDNATTGHINVDNFQFTATALQALSPDVGGGDPSAPVWGFADLHSHPMAHLAFGGVLLWGQPDGPIDSSLAWCTPAHGLGGTGIGGQYGNILMAFFEETGYGSGIGHRVGGYPQFDGWPRFTTLVHQQMYIDWIRRAYDGGLRLLVAHVVNNELAAHEYTSILPYDDVSVVETQIAAMKTLVSNHSDWMQIAYSSSEARSIIQQNKLAIVLGIEVDSLGGWNATSSPTQDEVITYLNHIYNDLGVRHLFPVHMIDNAFSGPAIYNDVFALTNYYVNKDYFQVEDGTPYGIQFQLEVDPGPAVDLGRVLLGYNPPDAEYKQYQGHINQMGLTNLGNFFLQQMMLRGMIIEVDHMSYKSVEATLTLAEQNDYPVVAGHTFFQELMLKWQEETSCIRKCSSEQSKTPEQVQRISNLGGMVAPIACQFDLKDVGDVIPSLKGKVSTQAAGSASTWAQAYLYAVEKMGGRGVGIGTDTNGFAKFNSPRFGMNAAYYLDDTISGWEDDSLRRPLRAGQVSAQQNGVKYSTPIQDVRSYRFEGILEGNVYDATDQNIWQATGLYYAGLNPWTGSSIPDANDDVINFAKGYFATSASQLEQPGLLNGDAPYEQKAAFLVKAGQRPTSSDPQQVQDLYPKVLAIWQRWLAMQGSNTPLTRSTAGQRDFDINLDGVAHYGLLPDLFQDLKNVGLTDADLVPLFRSANDYIEMWARCESHAQALSSQ